jgi:hypothetical protein
VVDKPKKPTKREEASSKEHPAHPLPPEQDRYTMEELHHDIQAIWGTVNATWDKVLQTWEKVNELEKDIEEIYLIVRKCCAAKGFKIIQIKSGEKCMITGIQAGQSGTFQETPVPSNGALQAGSVPTWTTDNPDVTLTPSADGTTVVAAVAAATTTNTFNLTVSGVSSDPTIGNISDTVAVPILPVVVPPVPATGFVIDQIA